jgi:hypothetical protein
MSLLKSAPAWFIVQIHGTPAWFIVHPRLHRVLVTSPEKAKQKRDRVQLGVRQQPNHQGLA